MQEAAFDQEPEYDSETYDFAPFGEEQGIVDRAESRYEDEYEWYDDPDPWWYED